MLQTFYAENISEYREIFSQISNFLAKQEEIIKEKTDYQITAIASKQASKSQVRSSQVSTLILRLNTQ